MIIYVIRYFWHRVFVNKKKIVYYSKMFQFSILHSLNVSIIMILAELGKLNIKNLSSDFFMKIICGLNQ